MFGITKTVFLAEAIRRSPAENAVFVLFASLPLSFKERGGVPRGRAPGGSAPSYNRRGAAPVTPARGIFEKIPLHPKNFEKAKNCVFCRKALKLPAENAVFGFMLLCSFLSKKGAGVKGQGPLGKGVLQQKNRTSGMLVLI